MVLTAVLPVRWDGCDTRQGTSKFGPKKYNYVRIRDWSKSQPATLIYKIQRV